MREQSFFCMYSRSPCACKALGCGLKSMFETTSNLHTFWIQVKLEYPEMAKKALKSLLPFPTTCLREAGLWAMTATRRDDGVDWTCFGCQCLPSPQMEPSSRRKTGSGLPPILHYGVLYNYFRGFPGGSAVKICLQYGR